MAMVSLVLLWSFAVHRLLLVASALVLPFHLINIIWFMVNAYNSMYLPTHPYHETSIINHVYGINLLLPSSQCQCQCFDQQEDELRRRTMDGARSSWRVGDDGRKHLTFPPFSPQCSSPKKISSSVGVQTFSSRHSLSAIHRRRIFHYFFTITKRSTPPTLCQRQRTLVLVLSTQLHWTHRQRRRAQRHPSPSLLSS